MSSSLKVEHISAVFDWNNRDKPPGTLTL